MEIYDLIIVGGGASGMMAAISAKQNDPKISVCIIEKNSELGKKILICGSGRCNLTNIHLKNQPFQYFHGANKDFLNKIFAKFGYDKITRYFDDLGVILYEDKKEGKGKIFPITNQASTVRELLADEIKRLEIKVQLESKCLEIKKTDEIFEVKVQTNSGETQLNAKSLILSAGGKSYPALGSDGSGFEIAKKLGHKIVEPVPIAVPIIAKNQLSQTLQGVHMNVSATTIINHKDVETVSDEIVFTQYGFSGPAILELSRSISIALYRDKVSNVEIKLNFAPNFTRNTLEKYLENRWAKRPDQLLANSLYGIFPNKFCIKFLEFIKIDPNQQVKNLNNSDKEILLNSIFKSKFRITDVRGWEFAEFTSGGVSSKEINVTNLESKLVKNLYFCGEIIDIDGKIGGYNLSWAWASGFIAGQLL